jgi:hypothetical protein
MSNPPLETVDVSAMLNRIYREYQVGEYVRFWMVSHAGTMTEGRVIHRFMPPGHTRWLYVIEVEHEMGFNYEVRSGSKLEMRPSPGADEYESWFA